MTDAAARTRLLSACVWGIFAVCWFATIQIRPLFDQDEGRYAEIPREMWVSGDWITPRLNDIVYFEKPPLQYWATASAYALFGLSEWTSRAWSFTLAFLMIVITAAFSSRVHGRAHGAAAAAVLTTSPYFVVVGHLNLLDSAFSFFLVGAVLTFLLAQREPQGSTNELRWMMAAWSSVALAVLSKGIVAPVLAGATLVAYSVFTRDWRSWRRLRIGAGAPVFLLITLPWFWMVSQRHSEFLQFFFVHEHLARFLTTIHAHAEPWWYFLPIVLFAIAPWITHLWPSMRSVWRMPGSAAGIHIERFLVIWCVVVVAFFSASGSKLASYVLPMMPTLAILLAPAIVTNPKNVQRVGWLVLALVAIASIGWLIYAVSRHANASPALSHWAIAALVVATVATLLSRAQFASALDVWRYAPLAIGSLLAWQFLLMSYAEREPTRTSKDLVAAVRDFIHPETVVFSVGQYRQSISAYLGRTVRLAGYEGEIESGLERSAASPLSVAAFEKEWSQQRDAVAFIDPRLFKELHARGLQGVVLNSDARSIVLRHL